MPTSIRSEATRSVVVVNGVDKLAINEDGSMELLAPAANPSGNKVPTAGQLPFTKGYISPQQTISNAGALSLMHSLGVSPAIIQLRMICVSADIGYSIGDEVVCQMCAGDQAVSTGVSVVPTNTTIEIRFGATANPMLLNNKATGATVFATSANWRLIVRAWA